MADKPLPPGVQRIECGGAIGFRIPHNILPWMQAEDVEIRRLVDEHGKDFFDVKLGVPYAGESTPAKGDTTTIPQTTPGETERDSRDDKD
jgi:hypothetical protein